MKILQLHVDYVEYEPIKKEMSVAEDAEKKKVRIENCLLLLTSVEDKDDESTANRALEEIITSLKNLKVNKIVIYPYAHLSNTLADPVKSILILNKMERIAKKLE